MTIILIVCGLLLIVTTDATSGLDLPVLIGTFLLGLGLIDVRHAITDWLRRRRERADR